MSIQSNRLCMPALAPPFQALKPRSRLRLPIISGGALMIHGRPKITTPLGATDMLTNIGFAPT